MGKRNAFEEDLHDPRRLLTHRRPLSDVPGALVVRWMAYIMPFDFTFKHIAGKDNPVADALSSKPPRAL